jgi:hypothetical protein
MSGLTSKSLGRFVNGLTAKSLGQFVSDLALKPLGRFYLVWPQNRWRWFSPVWPQNRWWRFLPVWPQNRRPRFPSLGLKTGNYVFVICASKLSRQFLNLGLKTNWTMVYRLRYKTDGRMESAWGTRRDLAAYFAWKQVRLRFFSLPQN